MQTQRFNFDEDMDDIERWWAEHEEESFDIKCLLSDHGRIIPGVCAAWLYLSDGRFAWIELPVSNPEASPRDVHEGLQQIFEELVAEASEHGAQIVVASPAEGGLGKVLERAGFIPSPSTFTKYFCGV